MPRRYEKFSNIGLITCSCDQEIEVLGNVTLPDDDLLLRYAEIIKNMVEKE